MADTVTFQSATPATPPSATVIATDDAGASGHVQIVKLAQSADGSASPVTADANGILVNLGSNNDVINAGTFAVQESGAALTSLQLIDDTVFAEDAAANAGDKGIAILAVRRDADTTLVGATNDYANLQVDANGYLKVEIFDGGGSHTVDNAGTFAVQVDGAALTSLQLIDDAIFAEDVAASAADKGVAILAVRRDADTSLVGTDNDYANLQVDANGYLKVEIFDGGGSHTVDDGGSTISIDDGAGSLTVDGTVTANLAAGTNNIGDVDVLTLPAGSLAGVTAKTSDYDTGAGTDTVPMVGIALPASGGAVQGGTSTNPVRTDPTGTTTQPISGTVTAAQSTASSLKAQAQIIDSTGDSAMDDTNNALRVNVVAGGAGDGSILDGVSSSIKATVLDYTNANPLAVRLTDTNGDYVGAGAGTQYTEDAAAAADPVGTALIMVRDDVLSAQTSADGDNIAARGTDKGELYVKHVDAIPVTDNGGSITVDGVVSISGAATVSDGGGQLSVDFSGQVTEDAASSGGEVSLLIAGVRNDAAASKTSADGDFGNVAIDAAGRVGIADLGGSITVDGTVTASDGGSSLTVDNGGTFVVQENGAALTALQLIDDTVFAEDVAASAGDKGLAILAVRRDADTSLVGADNDYANLQVNANGALKVEAFSGETLPVSLASVPSHAVTNAGTFAVQVDGSALTALQKIDDPVLVDDAAFTPGTSSVSMAGFEADETATDSVDEGDAGAARMTLDRKLIVTPQPHTAGGLSIFRSLDIDETEEDVKTSAGQVYGWFITNRATSARYVKFYNATAANVTVGTTTPVITLVIPGNSTDYIAANALGAHGIAFDTAICVAATTGLADNDTGAPGANDVVINIFYK